MTIVTFCFKFLYKHSDTRGFKQVLSVSDHSLLFVLIEVCVSTCTFSASLLLKTCCGMYIYNRLVLERESLNNCLKQKKKYALKPFTTLSMLNKL